MSGTVTETQVNAVLERSFSAHGDGGGAVLNILNDIQEEFRYVPVEALDLLSRRLEIPFASLLETVSAFDDFSLDPVGEHLVLVCDGTACHAKGAGNIISALEDALGVECGKTTEDGLFTLRSVYCVGSCGLAPIVVMDQRSYGKVRLSEAAKLPDAYLKTLAAGQQ